MTEAIEVEAEVIEPSTTEPSTEIQVNYTEAKLQADFTALEKYVDEKLKLYEGTTIDPDDEEQVKAGRNVCADLNKLSAPIDDRRKEIKKKYEEPLKAFEKEVKRITGKIESARDKIDKQVKEADRLYKERKRAALEEHYLGVAGEFCELIPYDKIHDDKWLNRSVKLSKAEDLISDRAAMILGELETLKATPLEYAAEAKLVYYQTVNMQAALKENQRLIDAKKELEDKEAIEAKLEESRNKAHAAIVAKEAPSSAPRTAPEMKLHYVMEFIATREQAILIRDYVNSLGAKGLSFTGKEVKE